jgi:hypothetical protein
MLNRVGSESARKLWAIFSRAARDCLAGMPHYHRITIINNARFFDFPEGFYAPNRKQ